MYARARTWFIRRFVKSNVHKFSAIKHFIYLPYKIAKMPTPVYAVCACGLWVARRGVHIDHKLIGQSLIS